MLCLAVPASAAFIVFNDRTTFNSLGTIVFNSNFDDFGPGFTLPGDPFYRGGVTYTSKENVIVGLGTWPNPVRNAIVNNYWTPLKGDIDSGYSLFGFDLAVIGPEPLSITLYTTEGDYTYPGIIAPDISEGFAFWGFAITSGQYFTGFSIDAALEQLTAPAITDVALGIYGVPEPSTLVLTLLGMGGLVLRRWMKR